MWTSLATWVPRTTWKSQRRSAKFPTRPSISTAKLQIFFVDRVAVDLESVATVLVIHRTSSISYVRVILNSAHIGPTAGTDDSTPEGYQILRQRC